MRKSLIIPLIMALLLSACAALPFNSPTATPEAIPSPAANQADATPSGDEELSSAPLTLQIWLPPQFAPGTETTAGALLQARLDEFAARHPGVRVVVRIKAEEGIGGLFESLANAEAAAPLALPDLIALPDELMRQAANRGLLEPLGPYLSEGASEDWYPFAIQMAQANQSVYGLPFAADALVLAYRPSLIDAPPGTWKAALDSGHTLAFPAANPNANFSLAMYQMLHGSLENGTGESLFEETSLVELLAFYEEASSRGLMPFWLTQYDTYELTFQALRENNAQMAVAWFSSVLDSEVEDVTISPLPTPDGETFTYARGYVWALSSPDPQHYVISVELAEWLSDSQFLAQWATAANRLPTRPTALQTWGSPHDQQAAARILPSAALLPDALLRSTLGTPLHEAVIAVLKLEQSPQAAAEQVLETLSP